MKLVVAARDRLRSELRHHKLIKQHVTKPGGIDQLAKEQLLELARKLGIDVKAIVADVAKNGRGMECRYEEDQLRTIRHCEKFPGFAGDFQFRLAFELLGKRIARQARAEYTNSPSWEYYDIQSRKFMAGCGTSNIRIWVKAERSEGVLLPRRKRRKPVWRHIDIGALGVLSLEVWDLLRDKIDERCQAEDALRRRRVAEKKRIARLPPESLRDLEPEPVEFEAYRSPQRVRSIGTTFPS